MIGRLLARRYRVISVLARGGTSQVLLCEDTRLPGRRWAVKLADPAPGTNLDELFDAEADLLSTLSHPALPSLVDRFREDDLPALVLEPIEGETLESRLKRGTVESERLTRALQDLLGYLHGQDPPVILVDLNPANILLTPSGVRVIDLGLARRGEGPAAGGRPGFVAPEATDRATPASDLYSLGAVLKACGRDPGTLLDPDPNRRRMPAPRIAPAVPGISLAAAALLLLLSLGAVTAGWLSRAPQEPLGEQLKRRTWSLLEQGDRQAAAGLVGTLLELDPTDPEALILQENASLAEASWLPMIVPVTGDEQGQGRAFLQGAALAQRRWNAEHPPVALRVCDDAGRIEEAMSWVQRLGADPRVVCVLGPTNSQRSLAVEQLAARQGLPVLSLGATHPRAWDNGGFLFTVGVPYELRVGPLAEEFASHQYRNAWLLYDPEDALAREVAFLVKQRIGPIEEQVYSTETKDFGNLIDRLEEADAIFFVAAPGSYLGEFARQLRGAGSEAVLYSNVVGYSRGLMEAGGPALDGLRIAETFFPEDQPFVRDFQKLFPGVTPGRPAAQAYDAVILAAGQTSREDALALLRGLGRDRPPFPGVSGPLSTGRAPTELPVYLLEIRSGKEELLRTGDEAGLPWPGAFSWWKMTNCFSKA